MTNGSNNPDERRDIFGAGSPPSFAARYAQDRRYGDMRPLRPGRRVLIAAGAFLATLVAVGGVSVAAVRLASSIGGTTVAAESSLSAVPSAAASTTPDGQGSTTTAPDATLTLPPATPPPTEAPLVLPPPTGMPGENGSGQGRPRATITTTATATSRPTRAPRPRVTVTRTATPRPAAASRGASNRPTASRPPTSRPPAKPTTTSRPTTRPTTKSTPQTRQPEPSRPAAKPTQAPQSAKANPAPPGTDPIIGIGSGRCIDILDGSMTQGQPLQIWDCSGAAWQKWTLSGGTIRNGEWCMHVSGSANGAPIVIAKCNGSGAQQFTLNGANDIVNGPADKCVDVKDKQKGNGARLQLWSCGGTDNQKWRRG
jgi:hypothetical protein